MTHSSPRARLFRENRGFEIHDETFFLGARVSECTRVQSSTTMYLAGRSRLIPTVAQSSASSPGRVVGSPRLLRRTTYPRVAASADIWHASTADTRKPSCMPTTRRLYTSRHYRRSHDADLGLGISRYRREPCAILARAEARERVPRVTQSLFLRRFIDESIGASFWKNTPRRRFYVTGEAGIKFSAWAREKDGLGGRDRILHGGVATVTLLSTVWKCLSIFDTLRERGGDRWIGR